MPFVVVYGIPEETPIEELYSLRRSLVEVVSSRMSVSPSWVRPIFVRDLLDEPVNEEDGCSTVYVRLDTAMFTGQASEEVDAKAVSVVSSLARVIWEAFDGRYEVEVFVGELNPHWKKLIPAKT